MISRGCRSRTGELEYGVGRGLLWRRAGRKRPVARVRAALRRQVDERATQRCDGPRPPLRLGRLSPSGIVLYHL